MTAPLSGWFALHRSRVLVGVVGLLLVVVAAESFYLYQERAIHRSIQAQSDSLLNKFMENEAVHAPSAVGVFVRLQNVRFKWSDRVYIDTDNMAMRAVPLRGATVLFDDLDSFLLTMQQSVVAIRPDVLEGMFNESVFNYPESKIRDLKVSLKEDDGQRLVHLKGSVKVVAWLAFTMDTQLSVDRGTNTLVMDVEHLKLLGFMPATALIKWKPFNLERIIALPPNRSLIVDGNRIMVKPFGLFPPPRVNGTMSEVTVDSTMIRLTFSGNPIPAPKASAKNYAYLRGGMAQFGHFRMLDTDVLVLDKNPANPFVFSLVHYKEMVPKSEIDVHDTRSVRVTMPDFASSGPSQPGLAVR